MNGVPPSSAELARLYDWEHDLFHDDVAFHVALAQRFGGPVLELACGTGRLLQPLTQAGLACTGVDRDATMLARARDRLQRAGVQAALHQQHLEELEVDGRFRTIILALDSLGLLTEQVGQRAALVRARQHLTHDGRLILDVSNGNLRGGPEPPEELLHHLTAPDPISGRPITKWVVRQPDNVEQTDTFHFFYDQQDDRGYLYRTATTLTLRWFTRFELALVLEQSGWLVDEVYGNYDLSSFGPDSDRLLIVARPT